MCNCFVYIVLIVPRKHHTGTIVLFMKSWKQNKEVSWDFKSPSFDASKFNMFGKCFEAILRVA